jgi:uncharacterized protein (TIGR03083 family)
MTATAGTGTAPDYQQIVDAVRDEFNTLDRYLGSLAPERWRGPTACTEWDLTKLVSHLGSGAVLMLRMVRSGLEGTPPQTQEERQQVWGHFDSLAPEQLYREFQQANTDALTYLDQLPADQRERRIPSFLGEVPAAVLLRARLAEISLHSWDVRVALDPTARLLFGSVGPLVDQTLGFVGRRSNAEARAELAGTVFELDLEGRNRRRIALVVNQDGVSVADPGQSSHRATLWLTGEAFVRLGAGRFALEAAERDGELAVDGDRQAALKLNALFPGY